ncbi:chaperonin GroEL [Candidatus Mesenet endosymbiont of Agriotes lineatus]|uniref:chaperonin GroEL n=1 Tax=Candidatus Mesenet endosymbiont of Agriotes lineatus TaxID=3077948 RepID=UPI0030CD3376
MANIVVSGERLQKAIREVASIVDTTVGITGGPKGRTVAVDKPYGTPEITKDGYKVMKNIKPEDKTQAAIMSIFNQSCSQCNEKVGDGTTTCSILTVFAVKEATKCIVAGANSVGLKEGMLKAKDAVLEVLKAMSRNISSSEKEIAQVATISANGDKNIGDKIADCVKRVGKEGVITVEESKGSEALEIEETKGMQFDRGYISPHFTTNKEKMIVEFENPYILVADKKISSAQSLLPILNEVAQSGRPLFIIAEDVEGEALNMLALNVYLQKVKVAAIKAPGFGDRRKEMLEDIRILSGAKHVISDELAIKMEDLKCDNLGSVKNIKVTKDNTIIVSKKDKDDKDIKARTEQIKTQIAASTSDYDKEKLQERLAKLIGGVAVLKVGGATEVEVKERRDRVEDALHATRAAIEEGIVAGGGVALFYAASALETVKGKDHDEQTGIEVIKKALAAPIRRIIKNSGEEGSIILDHLSNQGDQDLIYNVETMNYANAFTSGVIDPAKVVRVAFETAISVASTLITTHAFLVDVPSKDENNNMGAGAGGMGMDGGF